MSNQQLAVLFLLQLAVILAASRLVGLVAKRFGQPQVVAEMITGVLLGPSLLGWLTPEIYTQLFPAESRRVLYPISQAGLALYMFLVGTEFSLDVVRTRARSAIAVSLSGMLAPFVLGAALGGWAWSEGGYFSEKATRFEAMLFFGAALCITAFPMLARIIHFKKLSGTVMGTVALGAGALDDAAAWCLVAFVLASFTGDFSHVTWTLGGGLAYVLVVLLVAKPLLARWGARVERRGHLEEGELVFILGLALLGAWFTDLIGLHAVFGGFVMGAALPRGVLVRELLKKVEPLTVALLLPLFFTYSGLNTRLLLLTEGNVWGMMLLALAAAIVGKGVACWLAARATGIGNREALGIGTLMNARGLMELIILNIGLERGILTPSLFAVLVVMAIVTTLMASPVFEWVCRPKSAGADPGATPKPA